jgi:hypothetical protein
LGSTGLHHVQLHWKTPEAAKIHDSGGPAAPFSGVMARCLFL